MSELRDFPGLAEGETAWEGTSDGAVLIQQTCPDCDRGLLVCPARFCGRCGGSGYLVREVAMP